MKSYMITFSSNRQRLDNYYKTKQKLGGSLEMFDAIDTVNHYDKYKKQSLEEKIVTPEFTNDTEKKRKYGILGCNMSYVRLFEKIKKSNPDDKQWYLILEDDAEIKDGFQGLMRSLIEDLKEVDTDYVRLYSDPRVAKRQFSEKMKIKNNIYHMVSQWYTLAQLISGQGLRIFLSKLPMSDPIDVFFSKNSAALRATTVKTDVFKSLGAANGSDKSSKLGSLVWLGGTNDKP